jgi:predicted RND superfamily exporter protein
MRASRVFGRLVAWSVRHARIVIPAVAVLAVAGALLSLRLDTKAGTDTLADADSGTFQATERFKRRFGDDAVVILVKGDRRLGGLQNLVLTKNLATLLRLEGCLSGRVPRGGRSLPGPCKAIAKLDPTQVVYGPATFLNQSVIQLERVFTEGYQGTVAQAQAAGAEARRQAARRGLPPDQQRQAAADAQRAVLQQFQGQVAQLAVQYGLRRPPQLNDPEFVSQVVFDTRRGAGVPKARFAYLFPSRDAALISVRLRPGLSESQRAEAIGLFRAALDRNCSPRRPECFRLDGGSYVLSGAPVVVDELAATLKTAILVLLGAALLLMAVTLALILRAPLRLLPLGVALAAAGLVFGGAALVGGSSASLEGSFPFLEVGLAGGSLTMALIAVLPVLIGLAVDYAIQFRARFNEAIDAGISAAEAAPEAASRGAPVIATAGLATAAGFLALVLSPVPMVRGFGLLLVAGMVLAFACALTAGFAAMAASPRPRRSAPTTPRLPYATIALLAITAGAFAAEVVVGGAGVLSLDGGGTLLSDGGLCGPAIGDGGSCGQVASGGGEWWRLATSGFLTAGPIQLALDLVALLALGRALEPVVGTLRFAAIFLLSLATAIFGGLVGEPGTLTAPASGAIAGIAAAMLIVWRGRAGALNTGVVVVWAAGTIALTALTGELGTGALLGGLCGGVLGGLLVAGGRRRERALVAGLAPPRLSGAARSALAVSIARPRRVLVVAVVLAVTGWVAGTQTEVVSDFRELVPENLGAIRDVNELQDTTGVSGELNVSVEAKDLTDPRVVSWMRDFQGRVLRRHGFKGEAPSCRRAELCPAISLPELFRRRSGAELRREDVVGLFSVVPQYLCQGVATREFCQAIAGGAQSGVPGTANMAFGIRVMPLDEQQRLIDDIRGQIDPPGTANDPPEGVRASVAGLPVLAAEANASLSDSRYWLTAAGLLAVVLVLLAIYRSATRALVPLVPIVLATGWSALVLAAMEIPLNPMSATLGALVIAIATEFSVLLAARYHEEREGGRSLGEALRHAYARTGIAVMASGATAIVGFGALMASDIRMLRDFGLVTVVDLAVALIGVLLVLPAVLVLAEERAAAPQESRRSAGPLAPLRARLARR